MPVARFNLGEDNPVNGQKVWLIMLGSSVHMKTLTLPDESLVSCTEKKILVNTRYNENQEDKVKILKHSLLFCSNV